jgi:HD superfamily phosphodiesterase
MDYKNLLKKVEHYAADSFFHTVMEKLTYHNLKHTQSVVSYSSQLAHHYQLGERDFFVVVASAWLHDLGYATDRANHEREGAESGGVFLTNLGVAAADTESIKGCHRTLIICWRKLCVMRIYGIWVRQILEN